MSIDQREALDESALLEELRAWIAEHWHPDRRLLEWRSLLVDAGWTRPSWPVEHCGRGLPPQSEGLVADELGRLGVPGSPPGVGHALAGPTIAAHGPPSIVDAYLRPTMTGQLTWCQLFSEPVAGSDLAGLRTRAERDGDNYVVNGQKVWTTSADHADRGLLLARTDWTKPKHEGITCFAFPMKQQGVEVRPLRQMNGHASFNEVFITDARVSVDDIIGAEGAGWRVARTTLSYERGFRPLIPASEWSRQAGDGLAWRQAKAEAAAVARTYSWYPQRAGRPDLAEAAARNAAGRLRPADRIAVASLVARVRTAEWTAQRATASREAGRPGPEGSLGKLAASEVARLAAAVHTRLAGPGGMLTGPDSPYGGIVAEVLTSYPAASIAGGTDEIQRNVIAERVLGLPRDVR